MEVHPAGLVVNHHEPERQLIDRKWDKTDFRTDTLNPYMGVGAQGDFGYHYLLGGEAVNMTQDHSAGYHVIGLATFTFHLGF